MAERTGGIAYTVQVKDPVTKAILRRLQRIRNLDPALEEIGASNLTETQQRFEDEEDPEGRAWVALSDATLETRKGSPPAILRDQANLYDSLTYKVQPGRSVAVGTNRRYARIHQMGGKAGRGRKVTIPARPYLGLSEAGAAEVLQIVTDHLSLPKDPPA